MHQISLSIALVVNDRSVYEASGKSLVTVITPEAQDSWRWSGHDSGCIKRVVIFMNKLSIR